MLNICICQLIKDEQRYIEEWIDYYLNLGISKFILFEDWNSSSHADVLAKYGDKVILHKYDDIVNDEDKSNFTEVRQEIIWSCFYRLYKDCFDACLFIDPDEYLNCTKEEFLSEAEYFKNDPNVYTIRYHWLTRTASGHIKDPYPNQKYSLVKTYKNILPGYNMTEKFENEYEGRDYNIQCKHLIYLSKLSNKTDFQAPHGNANNIKYEQLSLFRLNHYLTKSWDEFKYKLYQKGEQVKYWGRNIEQFFIINKDLIPFKDELMKECESLQYKYNDYE